MTHIEEMLPMNRVILNLVLASAITTLTSVPARAHHAFAAEFDDNWKWTHLSVERRNRVVATDERNRRHRALRTCLGVDAD